MEQFLLLLVKSALEEMEGDQVFLPSLPPLIFSQKFLFFSPCPDQSKSPSKGAF